MNPVVQSALGVLLGSLPLLGVIGWAAFQQNARFGLLEQRLARIESHLDKLGDDLKSLGVRVATHDTDIAVIKTRLDGPKLVSPGAR